MIKRTDLAIESKEILGQNLPHGVRYDERSEEGVTIATVEVLDEEAAAALQKPVGRYVTVASKSFGSSAGGLDEEARLLSDEIKKFIGDYHQAIVVGLGNWNITPDALGPKVASRILSTRHITGEVAKQVGLENLGSVCALSPGVLGQTGVETGEIILALKNQLNPDLIIVIDALASKSMDRLCNTVQISDTGISPGSGVGNKRQEISRNTLGVPVVSIGVPTVVDAQTMLFDLFPGLDESDETVRSMSEQPGHSMIVTPREIDTVIDRASNLLAMAVNKALQPALSFEDIAYMVS